MLHVPTPANDPSEPLTRAMPRICHLVDGRAPQDQRSAALDAMLKTLRQRAFGRHVVLKASRGLSPACREADVIVSHLPLCWRDLPSLIALRACHPTVPLVHVDHQMTRAFYALNRRHRARSATLLRTAYALFDRVVALGETQADWLAARGFVRSERLSVIPPAVDLTAFRRIAPPRTPARVVGAIGPLDRQSGVDLLVAAMRAQPGLPLTLKIHGDGPDRAALEALAEGDPRIVIAAPKAPVGHLMAELDAVLVPSRWDASGVAALEARAAGRPVVVSALDGLHDHAGAGSLAIDPSDPEGWQTALRLLARGAGPAPDPSRAAGAETRHAAQWSDLLRAFTVAGG